MSKLEQLGSRSASATSDDEVDFAFLASRLNSGDNMRTRVDDESDPLPGGCVSPGNRSARIRSGISPRPAPPLLDPAWVLLGVTGYHP